MARDPPGSSIDEERMSMSRRGDALSGRSSPARPSRRNAAPDGISRDAIRQRKLLRAARRGDRGARERLVRTHLPLIRSLARQYGSYGLPFDDLVQEGAIGLLEAIDRYDRCRGPAFEAYARFRIRRAMRNALTEQARLIRLPKQVVERRRALDRAEARLLAAGERPTPAQLAAATGLSLKAVLEAGAATQTPMSLDELVLPDGSPLETLVADPAGSDPEAETLAGERTASLQSALAKLPARQRGVVGARWELDGVGAANGAEVAQELGVSSRRAQTIGQDALYALRDELEPLR
jgi:RNA polymerase primary sigma factor